MERDLDYIAAKQSIDERLLKIFSQQNDTNKKSLANDIINFVDEVEEIYGEKRKLLEVSLKSADPVGMVLEEQKIVMVINTGRKKSRLFLGVGDCLYRIDDKGNILDKIIPKNDEKGVK